MSYVCQCSDLWSLTHKTFGFNRKNLKLEREGCIKNLKLEGEGCFKNLKLRGAWSGPIETKCLMYVNARSMVITDQQADL